jgi:predicted LPLAT superfamily acyltransferase
LIESTGKAKHWADLEERGAAWGPMLMASVYRVLGRGACLVLLAPVILYFYVAGFAQRRASLDFLRRVAAASNQPPPHWYALIHFFSFGESLVDRFSAWTGQFSRDQVDQIDAGLFDVMRGDARGALILSAHFGATEVLRALAAHHQPRRITVVMHTANARRFNAMIQRFAPNSMVSLLEATEFGVGAAMAVSAAVERGDFVVIMADRIPVSGGESGVAVRFLGAPAAFPAGPFILASALKCPTYTMFCPKQGGRYRVHFTLLADPVTLPRRDRTAALTGVMQTYALALEALVKQAPLQWFNFYDFWSTESAGA